MKIFEFGLVHAPLTPFVGGAIDLAAFEKAIAFHIAHGAEGLAVQTHTGESVSLPVEERKLLLEAAIRVADGRVPVIANVSEAGTSISAGLASHARSAGAAALIASVPYYWTPPDSMLIEHFTAIAEAGQLPLFLYNSPKEMAGVKIKTPVVMALIEKTPYLAGVIDATMDWQFMIEVIADAKRVKNDFQLVAGTEYMISAHATGATGLLSPVANIAPMLVQKLYRQAAAERYKDAHDSQVDCAFLYRLFDKHGVPAMKAATRYFGRDMGEARPPLQALDADDTAALLAELQKVPSLAQEPRGW